jgi:pSer/pThr/pTyr-binding forkhead associated (FHA) protein
VIGRAGGGAQIEIDDAEVSRWHCAIEVKDGMVWLKDLESTNGTYFEEERTRAAVLVDGAQFRVGSTVLELRITSKK